jgi:hypothetical protein
MNEELTKEQVELLLNQACRHLYDEYKYLVEEAAHERSIVGDVLASYLRSNVRGLNVNTDYNREGQPGDRKPKTDLNGDLIVPDIIIHKWGPKGPNIAVIEVKGYWNAEDRAKDEDKLKRIQAKHSYKFKFLIELGKLNYQITSIN